MQDSGVKIKIVMHDGSTKDAVAESSTKDLKINQLIQLVRLGFCRVDKANKDIVLYFSHK